MSKVDPRELGFNYGRALPISNPDEKRLFETYSGLADAARNRALEASNRSWKLDMALRDIRHSVTVEERDEAWKRLYQIL